MARATSGAEAGIIVIWNDILADARDDFLEWHSREHIPERVAIPGFVRGQRWFGESSRPQYLTIYVTADAGVLTSAPYLERLNNPSPWTKRSVAAFRNTSRAAGSLAWQSPGGAGGIILTARIASPVADCLRLVADWDSQVLQSLTAAAGVARVRVALSASAASRLATAERAVRVGDVPEPEVTLLVEGFGTAPALRAAFEGVAAQDRLLKGAQVDLYSLQFDLHR